MSDRSPPAAAANRAAAAGPRDELFSTLLRLLFAAAGLIVLLWFVYAIRQVLLLFLLALVLALVINVPVTWMEDRRVPRGIATLIAALALALVLGALGWITVPRLVEEVPRLINELPRMAQDVSNRVVALFGDHPEVERQFARIVDWLVDSTRQAWRHAGAIVTALVLALFVVALVLYIVARPRPLLETYLRAMPLRHQDAATRAFARSSRMVVGWVYANAVLGGIKAVASFIFLTLMGIPGAVLWSVLALFAGLVPRLGFYLMAIPPVLVALAAAPSVALWVALFYWALSEFLGNFVAPKVHGELMDIHPVFVLFMTLALAYVFGALGVIMAPPIAGFIKIYWDEFYVRPRPEDPRLKERLTMMLERQTAEE